MLACFRDPISAEMLSSANHWHIRFEPSVNVGLNFKVSWLFIILLGGSIGLQRAVIHVNMLLYKKTLHAEQ